MGKTPSEREGRQETYWTSWQPAILIPTATLVGATKEWGTDQAPATVFAISVWPLSLTARGLWYASANHRWVAASFLTLGDGALLAYDAVKLASAVRVPVAYAEVEAAVGGLQLLYGVGVTARAGGGERLRNAALLTVPIGLVTHGVLSLALPTRPSSATSDGSSTLPSIVAQPMKGGALMSWAGQW